MGDEGETEEWPELEILPEEERPSKPDPDKLARAIKKLLRNFSPGEVIFGQGEPGNTVFVVHEGVVEIIVPHPRVPDRPVQLALLRKSDFFGEIAAFQDGVRSATAIAQTACSVLEVPPDRFLEIFTKDIEKSKKRIILGSARRISQANQKYLETLGQIHDLGKENEEIRAEKAGAERSVSLAHADLTAAKTEVERMRTDAMRGQDRADRQEAEAERLQLELSKARTRIAALENALTDEGVAGVFAELDEAKEKIGLVEGENLVLFEAVTMMRERLSKSAESSDEALGGLLEEMDALRRKLAASEAREHDLERQLTTFRAIRSALRRKPLVTIERTSLSGLVSSELLALLDEVVKGDDG